MALLPKESSLRLRAGSAAAVVAVLFALAPAAVQAASLELPAGVEATVEQGGSAPFTIPVTAGGAFTCATQATVQFDSLYSLNAAGELASGDPAGVVFSGADQKGSGNNCEVTWDGAPDPYPFTATATAALDTPLGDYEGRIGYTVENDPNRGPSGKLSSAGVATVTIHVIPPTPAEVIVEPPAVLPPAVQEVLGVRQGPRPHFGQSELIDLVKGKVFYSVPQGKKKQLTELTLVPNGTVLDAVNGVVKVTVESTPGGALDSADAWDGGFTMGQKPNGVTTFTLTPSAGSSRASDARAAVVRKRKRHLWVNGKGNFKTRGKRASAIVRGTYWLTEESTQGTVVVVKRGAVAVRDFGTKRTTLVTQGHSYLARIRARLAAPRFTG